MQIYIKKSTPAQPTLFMYSTNVSLPSTLLCRPTGVGTIKWQAMSTTFNATANQHRIKPVPCVYLR